MSALRVAQPLPAGEVWYGWRGSHPASNDGVTLLLWRRDRSPAARIMCSPAAPGWGCSSLRSVGRQVIFWTRRASAAKMDPPAPAGPGQLDHSATGPSLLPKAGTHARTLSASHHQIPRRPRRRPLETPADRSPDGRGRAGVRRLSRGDQATPRRGTHRSRREKRHHAARNGQQGHRLLPPQSQGVWFYHSREPQRPRRPVRAEGQ